MFTIMKQIAQALFIATLLGLPLALYFYQMKP